MGSPSARSRSAQKKKIEKRKIGKKKQKKDVCEKAWLSPKLLQMKPAPWDFFWPDDSTMHRCRCRCLQSFGCCWRCCHLWPWFMYLSYWISNAHTDTPPHSLTHTHTCRQGVACIKKEKKKTAANRHIEFICHLFHFLGFWTDWKSRLLNGSLRKSRRI